MDGEAEKGHMLHWISRSIFSLGRSSCDETAHTSFLPHFSHFWHVINIFFAIALPIEHSASSAECPTNFFKIAFLNYLLDNLLHKV